MRISDEASGILFVAWRGLYAEIIRSRIDNTSPNWNRAAKAWTWTAHKPNETAWGEYWRRWYIKIQNTSKHQHFPKDHQSHELISIDDEAHYRIAPEIRELYDSI